MCRRRLTITYVLSVLLSFMIAFGGLNKAFAQTAPKTAYVAQRVKKGVIVLDGLSKEQAWQKVGPLSMYMYLPRWGDEPTVRSEVRILYNDKYLYISGRLYYKNPEHIRATTRRRDNASTVNDMFAVTIDTYNDNETAMNFMTTPSGTRSDIAFYNDAEGPLDAFFKPSWNTFWRTESVTNERGWFVEIRIPISSMRFQSNAGRVKMGISIWRWVAYKQEAIIYPLISNQWGWWGQFKSSQTKTIVFEGIESERPFYITPYILGSFGRHHSLNEAGDAYVAVNDPTFDLGLGAKAGIGNNFTLDLTLNTDFAQVEADNQQINLTRFSLFFPEKRQFFLERAGLFSFGVNTESLLFYSRRIGLYKGRDIRILGGARLFGRVGSWDIGLLNMQTQKTDLDSEVLPSENFGVIRVKKKVFNSASYIGGMATSRIGLDGTYNIAYGLDGEIRVIGNEFLQYNWAQTFTDSTGGFNSVRMRFTWERRTVNDFGYELGFTRSGPAYNPGIGFELRDDFTRFGGRIFHGKLAPEASALLRRTAAVEGNVIINNEHGGIETVQIAPSWSYAYKNEAILKFTANIRYEKLFESFDLFQEAQIPAGDYTFYQLEALYDMADSRLLDVDWTLSAGSFFDGYIGTFSMKPIWSVSAGLKISGFYAFNRIRFPGRERQLSTHLARLHIRLMPSTKLSLSSFFQYNSAFDLVSINARLRFNPEPGNNLYLVLNQRINSNRFAYNPVLPVSSNLAVILKYSHTFTL